MDEELIAISSRRTGRHGARLNISPTRLPITRAKEPSEIRKNGSISDLLVMIRRRDVLNNIDIAAAEGICW